MRVRSHVSNAATSAPDRTPVPSRRSTAKTNPAAVRLTIREVWQSPRSGQASRSVFVVRTQAMTRSAAASA